MWRLEYKKKNLTVSDAKLKIGFFKDFLHMPGSAFNLFKVSSESNVLSKKGGVYCKIYLLGDVFCKVENNIALLLRLIQLPKKQQKTQQTRSYYKIHRRSVSSLSTETPIAVLKLSLVHSAVYIAPFLTYYNNKNPTG